MDAIEESPCEIDRSRLAFVDDVEGAGGAPILDLGTEIVGMAGRIAAATCRWLLLVAEFDKRQGAGAYVLGSTTHWLSHYCSMSMRTARDHVRVARALAAFPALVDRMGSGRLSYSHVRAIARLAKPGDHGYVDSLINIAQAGSVSQFERVVRGMRTVDHNEAEDLERDRLKPAEEFIASHWDDRSQWRMSAHLDPERGAMVKSVVELIARSDDISRVDAFVRMAEIALAALNDGDRAPHELRGHERAAVVVHVTADELPAEGAPGNDSGSAEPLSPWARVENGPGLPDRVAKRLACSGRVRTAVHRPDGTLLDLGRSHRLVTDRQFAGLMIRQQGHCAFPGCRHDRWLEAHHVRHWLYGGRTDLDNMILLCSRHHQAHHDGEFTVKPLGRGRFAFRDRIRTPIPDYVDPSPLMRELPPIEREHRDLDSNAITTNWDGERLRLADAITIIATNRRIARAATAT